MKRAVMFTFVVCCAISALSLAEVGIKPVPAATVSHAEEFSKPDTSTTTTTVTPITKATPAPTTNTTTHATTTTTKKTTTTTKKPTTTTTTKKTTTTTKKTTPAPTTNTTTHAPTTTTKKPTTTTTKKTTTTTKKPTTTTPAPPTPPKPTPNTNLTVGNYSVKDKGSIYLKAQMAVQIRLATPKANGTFIVQPKMTTATGTCSPKYANLNLTFQEGFINFRFNKSDSGVFVDELSFSLYYPLVKDDKKPYTASNKSLRLFPAKIGHSYSCKKESVNMGNGLYLDINQDQVQAYNLTKTDDFGLPEPCAADRPDYRVAIAVGVTLLVLVVVVLVAYLLGRRRKTDGYQSL
ncbi:hypothetical protein PBY51_006300 [Eleginops maclovinus]|uniref:Uncharacterized protein n=1 Tax=Eleginops maclovinus TaxID=56733 RepID=A0AAN8AB44_ELEMC|nr:hypothetical protein PBY51_006300 [Eleginops maclovinus]